MGKAVSMMRWVWIGSLIGLLAWTGQAVAQTPGFWLVGVAPGADGSTVRGLSQDGSVAVGGSFSSIPGVLYVPGFRWTAAGGRYDYGLEPSMPVQTPAQAVSSDGGVLVGYSRNSFAEPLRAFRRVGAGPLESL